MPSPAPALLAQCWIFFGILTAIPAFAQDAGLAADPAGSSPEVPFAGAVREWIAANGAPGVALVLRQNGRTTFQNFGDANVARHLPVTSDSIFELASITKVFTTTLLALALDRGEMSLDDPLARWLPELTDGGDISKVTLRQLATHTSSLPRSIGPQAGHPAGAPYTREEFFRYLREWHAARPPGTHYEYSNMGIGLLGLAIETRAKKSFDTLLHEEVLAPLGMTSTAISLTPAMSEQLVQGYGPEKALPVPRTTPMAWPASGALCSSTRDMARFLEANLGEGGAPAPLLAALHRAQQGEFKVGDRAEALAWQVLHAEGATLIDKNGGVVGGSTYIGMVPEKHLGLVILVNRGRQPATPLGRNILARLAGATLPPSAVNPAGGDPAQ